MYNSTVPETEGANNRGEIMPWLEPDGATGSRCGEGATTAPQAQPEWHRLGLKELDGANHDPQLARTQCTAARQEPGFRLPTANRQPPTRPETQTIAS